MGLAVLGAPASRAQSKMSAGEAGGGSEPSTTSATSAPAAAAAPSPEDLRQRIDALKAELADLNAELATEAPATPAASVPEQGPAPAAATPAPAAAAPMPLPYPAMSAPLSTAIPHEVSAGPFGKLEITGILSGIGLGEDNKISSTGPNMHWDVSNAQVFVQKTTGWWQFYLQGGAYNIPTLAYPFVPTSSAINAYGPLPVAFLKLVKGNFSVQIGELPTLVGAETTFDFENMNIERGLLWYQEPAISRGIQLNDSYKKLSVSFSWNDGYFSNRYTSFSGLLAYAINGSNTISFVGAGNAGSYAYSSAATPYYQNNGSIYNFIYMYSHGNWMIMPYYQYSVVPTNSSLFITPGGHTNGGALLANYNFKHGFSLAVRPEYIKSSGTTATGEANLLGPGPGTGAFSFTVTPTWAKDGFFLRGDLSVVDVTNFDSTADFAFGPGGSKTSQVRGVIEAGVMF